jgi:hypothetical protein
MYAIMEGVEDHDRTNGPIKAHLPCHSMPFAVGLVQSGLSAEPLGDSPTRAPLDEHLLSSGSCQVRCRIGRPGMVISRSRTIRP